jgi:hypothetical protein
MGVAGLTTSPHVVLVTDGYALRVLEAISKSLL